MSKLNPAYISQALKNHALLGDTDLFPRLPEVDAFCRQEPELIAFATSRDLSNIEIGPARRFVVPKDDFSLRVATQFDPFDSIALTSLILEFGSKIEARRSPCGEQTVFSYRFAPQPDGRLFDPAMDWTSFWEECERRAKGAAFVGYVDITDFYNQIYHHTLENQLKESGWPEYTTRYVNRLLGQLTSKVSRGIPVGPYATHLLAEATLIPIDNSFRAHGINYCRYVDDIVFFADSETAARAALFKLAEILDKQQRLTTNRQKTRLYSSADFQVHCRRMIEDQPLSKDEAAVLGIIKKYAGKNPYVSILPSAIAPDDMAKIPDALVAGVMHAYINQPEIDYSRLRWFVRRLSQIGHPGAVDIAVQHFEKLLPAVPDLAHYFVAAAPRYTNDWKHIGAKLVTLLEHDLIKSNDFLQISILSLFHRNPRLNHLTALLPRFESMSADVQREFILVLGSHNVPDVIREFKEKFPGMAPWNRRALLVAAACLPEDERYFFAKNAHPVGIVEDLLVRELKK